MFFNILITSVRFLLKNKTFTLINLSGLVLGLTAAFILFIFIINEQSYNHDFENSGMIFRVLTQHKDQSGTEGITPFCLAAELKDHFPQITSTFRIINIENIIGQPKAKTGRVFTDISGFYYADPAILGILGIPMVRKGIPRVHANESSVFLSKSVYKKILDEQDPNGRVFTVKINGKVYQLDIAGIFEDFPWNSTIQAKYIIGPEFFKTLLKAVIPDPEKSLESLNILSIETYILVKKGSEPPDHREMLGFYHRDDVQQAGVKFLFQPFKDIHLHSADLINDFNSKENLSNLLIYGLLSCFILFLAGMNYAILSTARSALRFKEIGIRKVFGATKSNLRFQIIIESVVLTFIAFPLSFLLLGLIGPLFETWYGYSLSMYSSNLLIYISVFSGVTIVIGLFSGLYAAVYLASLDPLFALKMKLFGYKRFTLSKIFIVFQLFITLSLLTGFITIYRQINFCLTRDLGLKKDNLLIIHLNTEEFSEYALLKSEILKFPSVLAVSGASVTPPTNAASTIVLKMPGNKDKEIIMDRYFVDYGFFETMGIKIIQGRAFDQTDSNRSNRMMLLNQEAVSALQLKEPLSSTIGPYKIIGITNNFNIRSQHQKIQPAMFCFLPSSCQNILVRYETGSQEQLLEDLEKCWYRLAPALPFIYTCFDSELDALYTREKNFGRVVASFTILAFVITGMGLFGLSLLIIERRRKEISIRKIFGASNIQIITRVQQEFYWYIGLAAVLSIPVSWYFLDQWLNTFYYHLLLKTDVFLISVLAVSLFVTVILLVRTIKVLKEKPVDVLKYE